MRSVFFGGGPAEDERPATNFVIPAPLSAMELRVLGCLIEKQFLTPDVYPLSLNALLTACNQKTSREPVVSYDDSDCLETVDSLQHKGLASRITGVDHRVPKYREFLCEKTGLRVSEIGILCVMMLRGPQTLAELKERTQRIHEFASVEEVEETVERLMVRQPQPLVVKLGRITGFKEPRYMHLLGGPVSAEDLAAAPAVTVAVAPSRSAQEERVQRLEAEVADLKERLSAVEAQFTAFRKQFE